MRLLAFSDIHHNLMAVRKLRASETNSFDAIVVAGDIGSHSAVEFFGILATFQCPVLYVFGNWDRDLGYRTSYGNNFHLLHSNVVSIGDIYFTGFSGCPANWGKNPIARKVLGGLKQAHQQETMAQLRAATSSILKLNRESLAKAVRRASVEPSKCVVITHQRLTRLGEVLPGTRLHLFGHIHQYSDQIHGGTRYINVAALDRPAPARPRAKARWGMRDCRNVNAGNYVKIEISSSQEIRAQCVYLRQEYPDWIPLEDCRLRGTDWIPEEKEWANSSWLPA